MRNRSLLIVGFALVVGVASTSQGALLGLTFYAPPDITVGFIDVTYDAGTDQFDAVGFALQMDDGNPPPKSITAPGYNFQLNATVDSAGNLTPGGSFIVSGVVTLNSITYGTSNPLLTGIVSQFGFGDTPANYDLLEIVITLTGGDLAIPAYYGLPGTQIGLDFDANYGGAFSGSFASSFDNLGGFGPGFGTGQCDIKLIPEPVSLVLMLGAAVAGLRRRI